jgi:aldehyde dehydrogenase (NAD+)
MKTSTTMGVNSSYNFSVNIDGQPVNTKSTISVINPATAEIIGYAPNCSALELDMAVTAAEKAFPSWSITPYEKRQQVLIAMAGVLEANIEQLSAILTAEQGKTLRDAAVEIGGAAYWLKETAKLELPESTNDSSEEHQSVTRHIPLGVIGAIAPWNYPIGLATFKMSSALLAGNTVVLKPSPFTPLTTLKVVELLQSVLPAGVLNVVCGDDALGPLMTAHPGIAKISFTGSTGTGRKVMAGAAATLKHLTLELGGNDAAIVLPDVPIDVVAKCIFWSAFGNSGQICLASKRVYVHEAIYDRMLQALVDYARTIQVGNGTDPNVQLGPIQNKAQYDRVLDLIADAVQKGYRFALGGMPENSKGYFVPLTIIDNPPVNARIVVEEQFGPVLPILKYNDINTVIAQANATEYGLGATVWAADTAVAMEIASRLNAGTVWVNEALALSPLVSFAGHKQSGLGAESGLAGLLAYTTPQTIAVRHNAATWVGIAGL